MPRKSNFAGMIQRILIITVLLVALVIDSQAQCSMCNAVVESGQKNGSELAEGLNAGILYLMGIPYALLLLMGIILFRKLNQNQAESQD